MAFTQLIHENIPRVFTVLSYLLAFVAGLYISRSSLASQLPQTGNHSIASVGKIIKIINSPKSEPPKSLFRKIGTKYNTDKVTLHGYDKMYEKNVQRYVGKNITVLEIGLGCGMPPPYGVGASAYLWREYFGPLATIHFIEYDKKCGEEWFSKHGEKLKLIMHYGSQDDVDFLKTVNSEQGYFDLIVDDGGHTMKQQITSFINLLPKVRPGGIYVIEDLQTSYSNGPDSGYHVNTTTIEMIKQLVDDIQVDSPYKSMKLAENLFSFEISDNICLFNLK